MKGFILLYDFHPECGDDKKKFICALPKSRVYKITQSNDEFSDDYIVYYEQSDTSVDDDEGEIFCNTIIDGDTHKDFANELYEI